MSTNSRIGYMIDGSNVIKSVYCHWDGYTEYNGRILAEHYNSLDKVKALVSLGSISSLGETLDYRDDDHPEGTIDYFRWRGEPILISTDYGDSDYFYSGFDCSEEYLYLFADGCWKVARYDWDWFRPLDEVLANGEEDKE